MRRNSLRRFDYFAPLVALCAHLVLATPALAQSPAEPAGDLPPRHLDESEGLEDAVRLDITAAHPSTADEPEEEVASPSVSSASVNVGQLPSADELFAAPQTATPKSEPSPQELAQDAAHQDRAASTPLEAQDSGSESVWTILPALQDLQRLIGPSDAGTRSPAEIAQSYDLSPYVDSPEWQRAMELMRADACKEALTHAKPYLEALDTQPPAIQFALARMQSCAGDREKAGKVLRTLAKRDDVVGQLAKLRLGIALDTPAPEVEASADEREAATLLSAIDQARKLATKKDHLDEALSQLAALRMAAPSSWAWYRVRLTEAELLERASRVDDASQVWLSIYLRTRDWKSGDKIEDMIEAFERRHTVQVLGVSERVDRARELVERGRYKEAKKAIDDVARFAKADKKESRAWTNYYKALVAERDKDRTKAVDLFEQAERETTLGELRLRLYFGWARALRRLDRDNEAIALYDRMCEEFPAEPLCAEAMYEAGRLLQYQNKHELASAHFESLVGLFPDHPFVPDALWRAAFSKYLQEDYAAVEPILVHLRDFHGDERDESELTLGLKAQYWLGVAALKRGDRFVAARELQRALDRGPLTWYGRLAATRLEQMGITPFIHQPPQQLGVDDMRWCAGVFLPKDPRHARAVELIRAGLYQDASDELSRSLKLYPPPEGTERLLAVLHLAMGRPDLGHWNMKRHLLEQWPTARTLRDWATAFPLDYMDITHQWGVKYGVDPFLIQAIIRQESGFRPTVKSYAGAVGLMQLMPATARYTAKLFLADEIAAYKKRDLLEPEKNIQLGAMYIRIHTAHAMDNPALALAGYNAGAAPLKRWLSQYGDRELDAWVESITYKEARGYVRKVMTSYITYSWLYGNGKMPAIGLAVPKLERKWGELPEIDGADPQALRAAEEGVVLSALLEEDL